MQLRIDKVPKLFVPGNYNQCMPRYTQSQNYQIHRSYHHRMFHTSISNRLVNTFLHIRMFQYSIRIPEVKEKKVGNKVGNTGGNTEESKEESKEENTVEKTVHFFHRK
jgi:hypothetical protein